MQNVTFSVLTGNIILGTTVIGLIVIFYKVRDRFK